MNWWGRKGNRQTNHAQKRRLRLFILVERVLRPKTTQQEHNLQLFEWRGESYGYVTWFTKKVFLKYLWKIVTFHRATKAMAKIYEISSRYSKQPLIVFVRVFDEMPVFFKTVTMSIIRYEKISWTMCESDVKFTQILKEFSQSIKISPVFP